jgi:YD repeat-containing protein
MVRFSEHRLIYATQRALEAQRIKAGVTVQNDMTKKPTRVATDQGTMSATEYAAAQQKQRQVSNEPATAQSFMDASGRDTRFTYDAQGNRSDQMTSAGTMAPVPTVLGSKPYQAPEQLIDQHLTPLNSSQKGEQKRLAERQAKLSVEEQINNKYAGSGASQTDVNNEIASVYNMDKAKQDAASTEAGNDAASSAAATEAQDPMAAGMQGFLANLPPEAQALAPLFENILHSISAGQEESAKATEAMLNGGTLDVNGNPVQVQGLNPAYDAMEKKIADMEAGYTQMQEGIQGMLDKAAEQQEEAISQQEKAAKDRMAWQETDMLRQAAREKQAAVDSRIARLALTGGFGSDGGLREIEETRASYENRMDDIKTEFGVQRTELAAKFTGMYLEASNNHLNASIQNIKDTASALERIAGQSLSTKQARMSAENSVLTNFLSTQTAARKEYATELKNYAGTMQDMMNQSRADKRAQEQIGFQQLEWAIQNYGTSMPDSFIETLAKKLPGVDVRSLAKTATVDEIKRRGTGSGGGGIGGFAAYMKKAGGAAPTFEDFMNEKKGTTNAAIKAAGGIEAFTKGGGIVPSPADLRAEYEARTSAETQTDPTAIARRFIMKKGTLDAAKRKDSERTLNDFLSAGDYEGAAEYVDSIGDDVPSTESQGFTQALNARYDVQKLHDVVNNLGSMGPVTGRLRDLNPYDNDVVRVQQLITQTVPNLARGIFKEVGILTDSDVERYTTTLENPRLTVEQAMQTYNDLMDKVNVSMQNQIDVWDANGKRTAGFKNLYTAGAPGTGANDIAPANDADQAYALSILVGQ